MTRSFRSWLRIAPSPRAVLASVAVVLALVSASPAASATPAGPPRPIPLAAGVDAAVLRVTVVRRSDNRCAVMVELRAGERISVQLRVIRYQSVIARSKVYKLRPNRWLIAQSLPAGVSAGRARVSVRLADRAGHVASYGQPIRIPAASR
jgi:hypothetical protein